MLKAVTKENKKAYGRIKPKILQPFYFNDNEDHRFSLLNVNCAIDAEFFFH